MKLNLDLNAQDIDLLFGITHAEGMELTNKVRRKMVIAIKKFEGLPMSRLDIIKVVLSSLEFDNPEQLAFCTLVTKDLMDKFFETLIDAEAEDAADQILNTRGKH